MPNETKRQVAIEAKHLRPRLDHVSLRPGAADALAAAFERRLTVICAPAGYGKTTTTAAVLDRCGRSAAWYKLDILDHDPLAFLAAMTRSLRLLYPDFGEALLRELESGPVVDLPVEVLAARFCSECDGMVRSDHHLVLDDYHEVMDSRALNDVLGYLIENCPQTVHFAVLTRYEPAFRLEKLRLAGEVARLSRDLFLFDAGQVAEVLAQRSGREHDPEHVRSLLELTEGWPASVVLAGMALNWLDVASLEEALADPRLRGDVFSYLAEQVFQRQSEDVQAFLLGTCCLEHVTAELGEALTGSSQASRRLHYLARNHIFTFDTERAGAYRYHNLLRDFLRQRFVQDEGEAAFRDLQRQTAAALEDSGDRPSAVELLLSANDLDLALGVIARGGEAELERRPYHQLQAWARQLEPLNDRGHPWALVVAGVLAARDGRYEEALSGLREAEDALLAADSVGLYDVLSITEWAEFWSGDSQASMSTCKRAFELASSDEQKLHTLLSMLSSAVDMRRWDIADVASRRAEEYLPRARPEEAARARALNAHAAYFRGDMRGAIRLVQHSHAHGERAAQKAAALNILGMIETALGDYESAHSHLGEAAIIADDFGHGLTSYMIEDSAACLAGATGQTQRCLSALDALSRSDTRIQEPSLRAYVLCHWGTALRRSGVIAESLAPTELSIQLAPLERDPYLALNASANLAYCEGLLGGDKQAELLSLSERAKQLGLRFVEFKAQLFAAVLLHVNGDRTRSIELLERCLPEQLRLGHVNLIAQELCAYPELASDIARRHRRNGLGPSLVGAMSHGWRFGEAASVLRGNGPSYVRTWLDGIDASEHKSRSRSLTRSLRAGDREVGRHRHTPALADLTPREHEVLELAASGCRNDAIAAELFISTPTVKTHMTHILRKLGQKTRIGAVLEYQRLVDASPPGLRPEINPRYDSNKRPRH
jgi:LuxR family maltose regulon positive regulatory protein